MTVDGGTWDSFDIERFSHRLLAAVSDLGDATFAAPLPPIATGLRVCTVGTSTGNILTVRVERHEDADAATRDLYEFQRLARNAGEQVTAPAPITVRADESALATSLHRAALTFRKGQMLLKISVRAEVGASVVVTADMLRSMAEVALVDLADQGLATL